MIRAGLFEDVDIVMDWHPSAETKSAVQSSLALVDFMVEYTGQAAHASEIHGTGVVLQMPSNFILQESTITASMSSQRFESIITSWMLAK